MTFTRITLAILAVLGLALTACGDTDGPTEAAQSGPTTTTDDPIARFIGNWDEQTDIERIETCYQVKLADESGELDADFVRFIAASEGDVAITVDQAQDVLDFMRDDCDL